MRVASCCLGFAAIAVANNLLASLGPDWVFHIPYLRIQEVNSFDRTSTETKINCEWFHTYPTVRRFYGTKDAASRFHSLRADKSNILSTAIRLP